MYNTIKVSVLVVINDMFIFEYGKCFTWRLCVYNDQN